MINVFKQYHMIDFLWNKLQGVGVNMAEFSNSQKITSCETSEIKGGFLKR